MKLKTIVEGRIWFTIAMICTILGLSACSNNPVRTKMETQKSEQDDFIDKVIEINYDGCQYLIYDYSAIQSSDSRVYAITHKGNCNNPIHHYEKQD